MEPHTLDWAITRTTPPKSANNYLCYYDPNNPAKNALADFEDLEIQALGPVPLCLFGVGALAFYIWRQRKKLRDG
jgi:hypothetical protein